MNDLRELGLLLGVCVLGDVLSALMGGALPGNVLGMAALLMLLCAHLLRPRHIERAADFFLKHMAVFFLPVSLGILELYVTLRGQLLAIVAICLITTFLTAFATAGTVHLVLRLQRRTAMRKEMGK